MRRQDLSRGATTRTSGGFSLIELLVGVGISLVIALAAAAMYMTTAGIGRANLRVSEIQSNGQMAMDALRRDIINAGFRGLTGDPVQITRAAVAITNDCGGNSSGFSMNLRQGVWGANDTNPFTASCIPTANYLRGDLLAVRRLGITPTGTLAATRLYVRSAFQAAEYFLGNAPPALAFNPMADYAADASVYFISPFTVSADESPQVPALYRVRLLPGPAMSAPELVASGVEDLQVQFDVRDWETGDVRILDAGGAPLDAGGAATGFTGWEDAVAIRVFLLVRAQTGETGFEPGSRTYALGSSQLTFNDNIPRQVMSSVFSLRNR